jgi:hypothetical protein
MSCNSCSNVTLPGVVGPTGAAGADGTDGRGITSIVFYSTTNPVGTAGVAGYVDTYRITYTDNTTVDYNVANGADGAPGANGVSILHYDVAQGTFSASAIGITNQTTATTKRSFIIPENTWEIEGDMVEVELMMIGERYESAFFGLLDRHNVYLELDGNPIEIDHINTTLGAPGYAGCSAINGPLIHLKTQLILTDVATKNIIPITDFESKPGIYSDLTSDTYITSKGDEYNFNHRGSSTNPSTALDAQMNLKVSATSVDSSVSVNMFYAKITSYKKS